MRTRQSWTKEAGRALWLGVAGQGRTGVCFSLSSDEHYSVYQSEHHGKRVRTKERIPSVARGGALEEFIMSARSGAF